MTNDDFFVRRRRLDHKPPVYVFDSSRGPEGLKKHPLRSSQKLANERSATQANNFDSAYSLFWKNMRQIIVAADFLHFSTSVVALMMYSERVSQFLVDKGEVVKTRPTFDVYKLANSDVGRYRDLTRDLAENLMLSQTLPKLLLPAVVSHYDALVARIIDAAFLAKPELARGIDRKIGIEDLLKFSSIEDARRYFIDKEIDHVMRGSHQGQLLWLAERTSTKIEPNEDLVHRFYEMIERRNIIVHNDSVINQQYIEGCARVGIDTSKMKPGTKVTVNADYVVDAANAAVEMGTQLSQVIWRKFLGKTPDELEKADQAIHKVTYDLIALKKYRLGQALFGFCHNHIKRWSNERTRLMNLINHANLLALKGDKKESATLLQTHDWSAASLDFRMCEAAIRADGKACAGLLRKHGKAIEIKQDDYGDWPLFAHVADDEEFRKAYEEVFGIPLTSSPRADTDPEQAAEVVQVNIPIETTEYNNSD